MCHVAATLVALQLKCATETDAGVLSDTTASAGFSAQMLLVFVY